jgi:hypothetical protein
MKRVRSCTPGSSPCQPPHHSATLFEPSHSLQRQPSAHRCDARARYRQQSTAQCRCPSLVPLPLACMVRHGRACYNRCPPPRDHHHGRRIGIPDLRQARRRVRLETRLRSRSHRLGASEGRPLNAPCAAPLAPPCLGSTRCLCRQRAARAVLATWLSATASSIFGIAPIGWPHAPTSSKRTPLC